MKRHEALPKTFLSKEDVPKPILATVDTVAIEEVRGPKGMEEKPILHFRENDVKPMVLNGTNWDAIEDFTGEEDSDNWQGTQIVIFVDANVRMGGKRVGGLRIRAPKGTVPPEDYQPPEEPPTPDEEDIPF